MATLFEEMTPARHAVEVAKEYGLRVITEENSRDGRDEHIELLKNIITDLKTNDRFYSFRSLQELHELYVSVCPDAYSKDFIHNGATFVALTLGAARYKQATMDLATALLAGFTTTVNQKSTNLLDLSLSDVLENNSWLVFCLLCRYAWFNEPEPGQPTT